MCRSLLLFLVLLGAGAPERADAAPDVLPRSAPAAVDWARAQAYPVILGEFHYEPVPIVLRVGQPYVLRLQNAGRFSHTFTAPSFFHAAQVRQDPAGKEAGASGGVVLAAGKTMELGVLPLQAGSYALECTKPLHALLGMSGDIIVQ